MYIVTTNPQHPAHTVNDDNLSVISYKDKVDLKDLFAKVKSFGGEKITIQSGGEKITIQSGGEMNTELMRAGLISFVSLVVAPLMVGGRNTASLLDGRSLETEDDLQLLRPLELISADKLNDSYLHLKYKVIN